MIRIDASVTISMEIALTTARRTSAGLPPRTTKTAITTKEPGGLILHEFSHAWHSKFVSYQEINWSNDCHLINEEFHWLISDTIVLYVAVSELGLTPAITNWRAFSAALAFPRCRLEKLDLSSYTMCDHVVHCMVNNTTIQVVASRVDLEFHPQHYSTNCLFEIPHLNHNGFDVDWWFEVRFVYLS